MDRAVRVLTVGDGDLSFSAALLKKHPHITLVATTYDPRDDILNKYSKASKHIQFIQRRGGVVLHNVNAVCIAQSLTHEILRGCVRECVSNSHCSTSNRGDGECEFPLFNGKLQLRRLNSGVRVLAPNVSSVRDCEKEQVREDLHPQPPNRTGFAHENTAFRSNSERKTFHRANGGVGAWCEIHVVPGKGDYCEGPSGGASSGGGASNGASNGGGGGGASSGGGGSGGSGGACSGGASGGGGGDRIQSRCSCVYDMWHRRIADIISTHSDEKLRLQCVFAFDFVIFNQPHSGTESLQRHRNLVAHYLHSAARISTTHHNIDTLHNADPSVTPARAVLSRFPEAVRLSLSVAQCVRWSVLPSVERVCSGLLAEWGRTVANIDQMMSCFSHTLVDNVEAKYIGYRVKRHHTDKAFPEFRRSCLEVTLNIRKLYQLSSPVRPDTEAQHTYNCDISDMRNRVCRNNDVSLCAGSEQASTPVTTVATDVFNTESNESNASRGLSGGMLGSVGFQITQLSYGPQDKLNATHNHRNRRAPVKADLDIASMLKHLSISDASVAQELSDASPATVSIVGDIHAAFRRTLEGVSRLSGSAVKKGVHYQEKRGRFHCVYCKRECRFYRDVRLHLRAKHGINIKTLRQIKKLQQHAARQKQVPRAIIPAPKQEVPVSGRDGIIVGSGSGGAGSGGGSGSGGGGSGGKQMHIIDTSTSAASQLVPSSPSILKAVRLSQGKRRALQHTAHNSSTEHKGTTHSNNEQSPALVVNNNGKVRSGDAPVKGNPLMTTFVPTESMAESRNVADRKVKGGVSSRVEELVQRLFDALKSSPCVGRGPSLQTQTDTASRTEQATHTQPDCHSTGASQPVLHVPSWIPSRILDRCQDNVRGETTSCADVSLCCDEPVGFTGKWRRFQYVLGSVSSQSEEGARCRWHLGAAEDVDRTPEHTHNDPHTRTLVQDDQPNLERRHFPQKEGIEQREVQEKGAGSGAFCTVCGLRWGSAEELVVHLKDLCPDGFGHRNAHKRASLEGKTDGVGVQGDGRGVPPVYKCRLCEVEVASHNRRIRNANVKKTPVFHSIRAFRQHLMMKCRPTAAKAPSPGIDNGDGSGGRTDSCHSVERLSEWVGDVCRENESSNALMVPSGQSEGS